MLKFPSSQAPEYRIAEPSIAMVTQFESREQKLATHRSKGPAPSASSAAAFPTLGGGGGGGGGCGISWGGGVKIAKKKAKPKVRPLFVHRVYLRAGRILAIG